MRPSDVSIAPWSFLGGNKATETIVSGPLIAHDYRTLLGAAAGRAALKMNPFQSNAPLLCVFRNF
jgi:hypothetical protein